MLRDGGLNPWLSIWVRPRETIRRIVKSNPKSDFVLLSTLYGLPMVLHAMQNLALGNKFSVIPILIISLILAPFCGMIGITIMTWLLNVTGKWIGGTASFQEVRAVSCWSNVPSVVTLLMWLALIVLFNALQ